MSFKAKLRQLRFWAGNSFSLPLRKNKAERARDAALKHSGKKMYFRRADGKLVLKKNWFKKAMRLSWKNPESAKFLVGTLKNCERRGVLGAEISKPATTETISIVTAINALLMAADGKYIQSWVQYLLE